MKQSEKRKRNGDKAKLCRSHRDRLLGLSVALTKDLRADLATYDSKFFEENGIARAKLRLAERAEKLIAEVRRGR